MWKDLLTAYDGQSITYDASGNPTSYYNGTRWTFGWTNGRRLATATNGTTNLSYTYDADGLRLSKTVDGVEHTYLYAGGKLLRETYGNTVLDFFYDSSGTPYAVSVNDTIYYYITNLQGDVMSIVDAQGAAVASYEYDPYGNVISSNGDMAAVNPLRYRGYYFDSESGLYYLQSRYYDPKVGRFINADAFASTGQGILGNNMFVYCNNNPVMFSDMYGAYPHKAITATCLDPEGNSPWIAPPYTGNYGAFGEIGQKAKDFVTNSDEQAVLDAAHLAFYKGTLVVKIPGMKTKAFSFGIIFMGSDIKEPNLVRHEYGHTRQLAELGVIDYLTYVVVPSVTGFWLDETGYLPEGIYFSLPWEYMANEYGQATGYYTEWAETASKIYWGIAKLGSLFTGLF